MRSLPGRLLGVAALVLALAAGPSQVASAASFSFGPAMRAAADRYLVPLALVQAIAYVNSRWEVIPQPSIDGGVGPMNIRPDEIDLAAAVSGHTRAQIAGDPAANLDAGAALLARYHVAGAGLSSWRVAVADLLGEPAAAEVFDALRSGESRTTSSGETVGFAPQAVAALPASSTAAAAASSPDYPPAHWVAASTSNYSYGSRPRDFPIDMIVIHDTEGSYGSAIAEFQNPAAQSSAHYVVSTTGDMTQMVREHDIAWHAGNWDYNTRAIGIEHEGYAYTPGWYTTAQYNASAALTASICSRYGVPMDRNHVIGHYQVPDPNNPGQFGGAGHHTDPGPYWDWTYYMNQARTDAATLPSPPHLMPNPVAVASNVDAATVSWLPARSCTKPIGGYQVVAQPGNLVQNLPASATSATFSGLQDGGLYTFTVTVTNADGQDSATSDPLIITSTTFSSERWSSYHLGAPNDGATWVEIDGGLRVTATPPVNESAVVSANIDLWTTAAGYNQDVGLFVIDNGGPDQLLAWKESGGFAGTYSPNAAYVQGVLNVVSGHTYTFKLKLKPNRGGGAGIVYAAAGTAGTYFSPTRLTVHLVPTANLFTAVQSRSYHLDSANDGGFGSWVEIDPNLGVTVPGSAGAALVSGNIDLWTARAGYNQDVGLFVSVDGGADRQLAWKESGGFAGTYSPNAAFVQFAYSTQPGHNYRFKLKWKPNVAAPAGTLYAGAGTSSSGFSPTRLTVEMVAPGNLSFLRAGSSYSLGHDNDGGTWVELSPTVRTSLRPARNALGIVGGNIDLWTSQPGYNQDIGLFVCDATAGSCSDFGNFDLMAWKESGGFAGTYSPNAAYVQATWPMLAGHNYVFALGWKSNVPAPGGTIFGAAGTGQTQFSTTTLAVEAI